MRSYGDSFRHPADRGWLILTGFTVLFLAATWAVLVRKCRQGVGAARAGAVTGGGCSAGLLVWG